MNIYGVKEVSAISGITIRTLHYYDNIGLLKPLKRTEAGYRYYGDQELLRLQQILFYKELDFSLKEIQELLDDPTFDLITALENHRSALRERKYRISTLLKTIDQTIDQLNQEQMITNPEDLYDGFPEEMGTSYRQKAIEEYGEDVVGQSEKELSKLGKEGLTKLTKEFENIILELFELKKKDPHSVEVQQLIETHYTLIRAFWGTTDSEDLQAEAYAGLGELYVQDERFITVHGEAQPEYAKFLQQAMKHFAVTHLS